MRVNLDKFLNRGSRTNVCVDKWIRMWITFRVDFLGKFW